MSNQSFTNDSPVDSPEELRLECIGLVNRLYHHRLNIALLRRARAGLRLIAGYKSKRRR